MTLKAHPEIGRCAVEGHSDATGPDDWNKRLSVMRAETVVAYLTSKGVDVKRLSAIGQGVAKPWADNETAEGRARNRRVVFHIEGVFSSRPPPSSRKVLDADEKPGAREASTPTTKVSKPEASRLEASKAEAPGSERNNPDPPSGGRTNAFVEPENSATPAAGAKPAPPKPAAPPATLPGQNAKTLREAVRLPVKP